MNIDNFIIDTDLGSDIDDALAIILAVIWKQTSIVGIITTSGFVHCRTAKTFQLLKSIGCDIPVFQGLENTLSNNKGFSIGTECSNIPKKIINTQFQSHNVLWNNVIKNNTNINVISISPLTNLADIISRIPKIKKHIKTIFIMGGVFNSHPFKKFSNKGETSEHNLGSDSIATNIILNSGIDIVLIPLNITFETELKMTTLRLALKNHPQLHKLIINWTRNWLDFTDKISAKSIFRNRIFLHDSLTVAIGMNLINHKFTKIPISVNKDGLIIKSNSGIKVKVCTGAEIEKLISLQIKSLNRTISKI